MIVAPTDPGSNFDFVTENIFKIQQEILLIEKHGKEHVSNGEISKRDSSCWYCHRHQEPAEIKEKRKPATTNEIERIVDMSGKSGVVVVPKTWFGKTVKIILVEED